MKTCLVLTIASLLLASVTAKAEDQPQCLRVDEITAPHILAPGSAMEVSVRLKTSGCALPNDYGTGTTANLTIRVQPGIEATIGPITYSDSEGTTPYRDDARAQALVATIEIKASKKLGKGEHKIPALLNYDAIDEQGQTIHESLAFTIPVQVGGSSLSPPHRSYWEQHPGLRKNIDITVSVFLVALLWPVLVLECVIGVDCWTC